jgi:hypothetical protein
MFNHLPSGSSMLGAFLVWVAVWFVILLFALGATSTPCHSKYRAWLGLFIAAQIMALVIYLIYLGILLIHLG